MLIVLVVPATFRENVFAHGMYKGAKTARIFNRACLYRYPDTAEGFLANVFNPLRVHASCAKSDLYSFTEVGNKMGFGGWIAGPEAAQIVFIEGIEVHWCSYPPVYFSH